MGNMLVNKRVEETIFSGSGEEKQAKTKDYRPLPSHMYGGPKGLGDPTFRGLSKMEEDPLIPQRMRDISQNNFCKAEWQKFDECTKGKGPFAAAYGCKPENHTYIKCLEGWFEDRDFKEKVIIEFLNERSHYRETGVKTPRYRHGKFIKRDEELYGPALDENGKYRPQKPRDWDKYWKDNPPSWTDFRYD